MKLYGSLTSPFVRHCRMVALETQAPLTLIEIDASVSAVESPTKRMPYFRDGELFLSDSSAIIRYLRERVGQVFLPSLQDQDELCLVNTLLEVTTNLFFLARDGIDGEASPYLQRQRGRITSTLELIDSLALPTQAPYSDMHLRLAAYIGWCELRGLATFTAYSNISRFYAAMQTYPAFISTQPPKV